MIASAWVDERLGLVPVVALDGDDAPLGQGHRDERHDAGAGRLVDGACEVQVGLVEVALEQIGRPCGVEHGRPVGAQRTEALQRQRGRRGASRPTPLRHSSARR